MHDDVIITVTDMYNAGYCIAGGREWFRDRGLDFGHFVRNGIRIGDLPDKDNDAIIQRILEVKGII